MKWFNSDVSEEWKKIASKLDDIIKSEQEVKKMVTGIKRMETVLAQRLERVETLMETGVYGVTSEKREVQLIVSFTSYGKRIYTVPHMLDRLMNQTIRPDRIILYLSKENYPRGEAELPVRLLDMQHFGLELRWCEGDMKSYKKILPALKEFPEDIIITVDDDLYFELDLIENLYDSYKKYPDAISAMRVHKIAFAKDGSLLPYSKWERAYTEICPEPRGDLIATTGAGTLFPPHILTKETLDTERIETLCPTADDIWLKCMSALNHIEVVPPDRARKLKYISGTQEETLWSINEMENDHQIQNILDAYGIRNARSFFVNE